MYKTIMSHIQKITLLLSILLLHTNIFSMDSKNMQFIKEAGKLVFCSFGAVATAISIHHIIKTKQGHTFCKKLGTSCETTSFILAGVGAGVWIGPLLGSQRFGIGPNTLSTLATECTQSLVASQTISVGASITLKQLGIKNHIYNTIDKNGCDEICTQCPIEARVALCGTIPLWLGIRHIKTTIYK